MSITIQPEDNLDLLATRNLVETITSHEGQKIHLDCGSVRHVSAAFLQLLLVDATSGQHAVLKLTNPSNYFVDGLALLGVDFETQFGEQTICP